MIKRILHWFGKHEWVYCAIGFGIGSGYRECGICDRCEMQMQDLSWCRAHGLEAKRAEKELEE